MSEFDIVLINENKFNVNELIFKNRPNNSNIEDLDLLKVKSNYLDYEKSLSIVNEFCEIHTVTKDTLMENVEKLVKLDVEHYADVKDCYECDGYLYQVIYKMSHHEDIDISENILGSSLSYDKRLFYGKAILYRVKHSSLNEEENVFTSTNIENVLELMMDNYYHTGVSIDAEKNKFEQFYFNNELKIVDPLNNWREINNEFNIMSNPEYGFQFRDILGFKLNLIFKSINEGKVNEPMSRLLEGIVKGNGVIISPYNENQFYDITVDDVLNKL